MSQDGLPPPPLPPPQPGSLTPRSLVPRRRRFSPWLIVPAIVLGLIAVALLDSVGDDDDDDPGGVTELCDMLSDPANRRLTTGDIGRLFDIRQDELEDYVAERCPEHLRRVSES